MTKDDAILQIDRLGATLFDLVPCSVAVIDRDFQIVAANAHFADQYGDWEGRHRYEVFKRQHRPCGQCVALRTFKDGKVHTTEEEGINKEGRKTFFEVKTAPIPGASGEVEFVLEMSLDVSKFEHMEDRYRLLFERVPCFVTVVDRDYRIVEANWRHRETFGHVEGVHCYQTYMKAAEACESCPVRRTLSDGRVHTQQQEALDKKGERVHFIVHSAPMRDGFGEITHAIEMATDITPMIEMQQRLLVAEGEAAMERAMGILDTTVEQLRLELTEVASTLQTGMAQEDHGLLGQAGQRLQDRIDDLASIHEVITRSRAEEGSPEREVDPALVAEEVAARFDRRAAHSRIGVRCEAEPGLALVAVDPDLLRACLSCLVSDFIEIGVPRPGAGDSHYVLVRVRPGQESGVRFEVSYEGIGVVDQESRVVEPPKAAGTTGMSLGVVKKVIEARGGFVSYVSKPGRGFTFVTEIV